MISNNQIFGFEPVEEKGCAGEVSIADAGGPAVELREGEREEVFSANLVRFLRNFEKPGADKCAYVRVSAGKCGLEGEQNNPGGETGMAGARPGRIMEFGGRKSAFAGVHPHPSAFVRVFLEGAGKGGKEF